MVDEKSNYWCPHHVRDGDYDGLYVCSHKPKEHDEWAKDKKGFSKARAAKRQKSNKSDTDDPKLSLSSAMRSALVTNCNMTTSEANDLWARVCQESKSEK